MIEEVNSSNQTVSTATVNSGTPTSGTAVNGKKEGNQGVKYKVWAKATKGTNVVRSTNYVLVQTSHPSHYGDTAKGGDCYKNYTTCTNNTYYYILQGADQLLNRKQTNGNRYCFTCGTRMPTGYISGETRYNGKKLTYSKAMILCNICGASASTMSSSSGSHFTCVTCTNLGWVSGNFSKTINGNSFNLGTSIYICSANLSNNIWNPKQSSSYASVSHVKTYSLTCSGIVNGLATPVNF